MSKYVTDEAMRSAMTLQKGYIDQGDSNNAEGIDSLKKSKKAINLLPGVLTGTDWGSSAEAAFDSTTHAIEIKDGVFSIKEAGDNYIVSPFVNDVVEEGKTYTFSFYYPEGGGYEVRIIGFNNNHVFAAGGGGPIDIQFTSVATESVRILVGGGVRSLLFPQLELGSNRSQFTASTEELKKYHDMDTREREATLLERVTELEDRMEEVVQTQLITTPPETLNAQVGYYYCMGGSGVVVDTMTIQLPAIADENKTKNVQFFMTMGSAPEVTFVSAGTERILYQKDFALEAERSYEVNALWNGHVWVITVVEIIVPFFAKLSLNNGEVVELQGSGQLTSSMVSAYKSTVVSAEIGELCTSIGYGAFSQCTGLTSVTIGSGVTYIGYGAFSQCTGLTSVTIGSGVTYIGERAFSQCTGLTSITIPDSVTSIGKSAFYSCTGLTSITIPDSVTSIGESAFEGCTSLPVVDNIRYADTYAVEAVDKTLTTYTIKEGTKWIGSNAFSQCTGLTSITIPDSVTSIGKSAFYSCTGLTSITIPDSVTSIGEWAFANCYGITSIVIPDSVTTLDDAAFQDCSSLTSVTIGSGVTYIDVSAFNSCSSLTSVTIPDNVTSIASGAFANCGLTSIISLATTAPIIASDTFRGVKTNGTLTVPSGSSGYNVWMDTRDYYLGYYNWTKVEQ